MIVSAGYPTKKVSPSGPAAAATSRFERRLDLREGHVVHPSPILYGDYVYPISDAGLLTCLDAKTGAVNDEGGRPPVRPSLSPRRGSVETGTDQHRW